MSRWPILVALVVVLLVSVTATSWPEQAKAQEADNSLAIFGTVMVRGTRQARPGIRVGLSGPDQTDFDAFRAIVNGTARTATTDSNGRFAFTGLAAGRYEVSLASPENGSTSVLQSGRTITLTEFSPPPQIELWITPESRISGRVLGPDGEPVRGAVVAPMIRSWFNGGEWLRSVSLPAQERTDEQGRYSLTVPPGDYYLQVSPLSESPLFFLHPNLQDPVEASTILPFYYPGVPFPEDAIPLSVGEGADLGGVTIQSVGGRSRLRPPSSDRPGLGSRRRSTRSATRPATVSSS